MNDDQRKALTGQLRSNWPEPSEHGTFEIQNKLEVPIVAFLVDETGLFAPLLWGGANPQQRSSFECPLGSWVIWADGMLHNFLAVSKLTDPDKVVVIDRSLTLKPGDIGPIPKPNSDIILPDDSTPVVVGHGKTATGYVVRTQFYHCTADSHCLAPGEIRNIGVSTTTGTQSVSSDMETVSSSLNTSASAGWGPVSASVSTSLNRTSTTFQQYTITSETSSYDQVTLDNSASDKPMAFYCWQMIDELTIFTKGDLYVEPTAKITSARVPVVIDGPHDPGDLPEPFGPEGPYSATMSALLEGSGRTGSDSEDS